MHDGREAREMLRVACSFRRRWAAELHSACSAVVVGGECSVVMHCRSLMAKFRYRFHLGGSQKIPRDQIPY